MHKCKSSRRNLPISTSRFAVLYAGILAFFCMFAPALSHSASQPGTFGLRGALGTDISGGLGFGIGGSYTLKSPDKNNAVDLGLDIFFSRSRWTGAEEYWMDYDELTEATIIAIRVNGLLGYNPDEGGAFFIAGSGFFFSSVYWEIEYTSNIPGWVPYAPEDAEGTAAGTVLNVGAGYVWPTNLELRVEAPLLIFFGTVGEATGIAPTFTVTLQYRFGPQK